MKVISDFNYLELRRSTNGCLTTEARESISIINLSCIPVRLVPLEYFYFCGSLGNLLSCTMMINSDVFY